MVTRCGFHRADWSSRLGSGGARCAARRGARGAQAGRAPRAGSGQSEPGEGPTTRNFRVLGHNDLGLSETNGDVFVHGNFAYVGTWADPCNGRGVKILDVSDLSDPQLIGTLAAREGTSAEDMVVRRVSTPFFSGDLMESGSSAVVTTRRSTHRSSGSSSGT